MKTQPHNRLEDRLMSSRKRHWAAVQKKAFCISIMWPVRCDASCRHLILCRLNVNLCILLNLICWWRIKGRSRQLDIQTAKFTDKKFGKNDCLSTFAPAKAPPLTVAPLRCSPGTANATCSTRPRRARRCAPPWKEGRATVWRSCWTSSRTSTCPCGATQVGRPPGGAPALTHRGSSSSSSRCGRFLP